jgi:eukaryotic-like serine/threonine-protein kinase
MSLAAGARLGPYEVIALIAAGGMGEVYRARDTRLQRDVAIKILPAAIADNAIRRARFEREAQAVSRLNHPNICAVYDVGTQDGIAYVVMEYIEGESLAQCLRRGPFPAATALRVAIQMAAGLDAAHRRGIIHRDLKPANVMVADQIVKLLDFGLAKLHSKSDSGDAAALESTVSLTAERCVVGTLHYMAPEQLQGRDTDRRTDIFAFGAVLHEMITGRKAFDGDTAARVIAAILTAEPAPVSSSAMDAISSPALDHVMRRALAKDPDERWQTARDVMNELQWIRDTGSRPTMEALSRAGRWRVGRLAVGAVTLLVAIAAGSIVWTMNRALPSPIHLSFIRPIGLELTNTGRPVLAISPDGTKVVFNANNQLYIRRLDALEAVPIAGTQGAGVQTPFFSFDGRWVAFFSRATDELKRVPVDGGAAVTVCRSPARNFGATWTADDHILFAAAEGVFRVSAKGGTPQRIIDGRPGETLYGPQMLPDNDHVLLTVTTSTGPDRWDEAHVVAQSLSSGARTVLIEAGADARFIDTGHIVYAVGTTLFAITVDVRSLRTLGPPVTVLRGIRRSPVPAVNTGNAFVAISNSGHLAYIPDAPDVWVGAFVDLSGRLTPLTETNLGPSRVSPDGSQMLALHDNGWSIYSLTRRAAARRIIAAADAADSNVLWTPDGTQIVFRSRRESGSAIISRPADGGGPDKLLLAVDGSPVGWSRDGVLFYMSDKQIWSWMRGEQPQSLAAIDAPYASLSPDSNWVAFHTYEHGQVVPYIQRLSNPGSRFRVSADGGYAPLWSPDGTKLFYVYGETNSLLAVDVQTTPTVAFGDPVVLVSAIAHGLALSQRGYDITPNGRQLLVGVWQPTDPRAREIHVVLNWTEELKRLAPRR